MELNEMEKRLLFQVEGDYQSKVLNELYMTARYTKNPEQRKAAENLMAKLRVLTDAECMDIVRDIQKNYRLPYQPRTIGEKIAEARQQSGAEKLKGHDIMALERFDPEVRHMIVFDVLSYDSPVGDKGDNIGPIEHDPYVLMGYLTSAYQNFTYAQIEGVLRELFNGQYSLSFSEETETRYRTETSIDPETGEETEKEVPYEWHILNVTLTSVPLENLVVSRMNADQKEICEILLQTKGNRQYVKNVFNTNWLPYVTSYYGYRVHPISGGKNYHTGVDIGMPQGTEILAGHDGTVTLAGNAGGYGLCVAIEGEAYEGHSLTTKYGHCSQILVSAGQEVKAGDVVAKVGSTGNSTGPHLHLEVLVDGQYRNPLYFADTGDTSERHLPEAGAGGGGNYFDYDVPPEALADEKFAAMLAEAEKYLGYPYVWGGASPSTSFDCSGYVSWVVNHCGVGWNFGRLTADGLLGVCTPVSSADARPGDLIFFQGTYNTSGASHVGIYVGNGMMIHCGDPISYANINTSYWQQHFYTFARLP